MKPSVSPARGNAAQLHSGSTDVRDTVRSPACVDTSASSDAPALTATPTRSSPFDGSYGGVVIVKRDRVAAEYIRDAVQRAGIVSNCVCFPSATNALRALRERPTFIGIFGLTLMDMDGLDLIATVIRERLAFRILVVSTRRDEFVRSRLRPGRINGFFNPEFDEPGRLSAAIHRISEGGTYFTACSDTKVISHTLDQMFTPHQIRIFAALCTVGDEKEAASMLGMSEHTMHGHSQRIRRKLGVSKSSRLIIEGIRRGVIRVTPVEVLRPGFDSPIP